MAHDASKSESGWEKWHDWHARTMVAITMWFCDAIAAGPGQRVLDAACGTGLPSLAIAERVGPSGQVVATDVSPEMVDVARRRAAAAGISNIEHCEMDLSALAFPDASFDAATCKDGLMFCADPAVGAGELRRVLIAGGRFAVSAWDEPARAPFFSTIFETLARFVSRPPPRAGTPGPFRLALPGDLENLLVAAGFRDVVVARREVVFDFDSPAMHWQFVMDMMGPVRSAVVALPEADRTRFQQELADAIAPYVLDERVRIPNTSLCASGRR